MSMPGNRQGPMRQLRNSRDDSSSSSSSSSDDADNDEEETLKNSLHERLDRSQNGMELDAAALVEQSTLNNTLQYGYEYRHGAAQEASVNRGGAFAIEPTHGDADLRYRMEMDGDDENNGIPRLSRQLVLQGLSEAFMQRSLTKIDLSQRGLRPLDARLIKMALSQNKQIKVLKLGYNSLGDEGVETLCSAIAQHATLESLDIGFNQVGNAGCKALMDAISDSNNLDGAAGDDQRAWTLYLAGNLIGEDGALSIADLISRQTQTKQTCIVRRLYLTGNKLGPAGVKAIAEAILQDELSRRSLLLSEEDGDRRDESELHNNVCPHDEVGAIGGLEELFLGGTHMGYAGCNAVARLLERSCNIKTVSLPNCQITDDMLCDLATCIKSNRARLPLESLQLSFNRISCRGMEALTNAVWASRSLRELFVDNNEIGDAGAQLVATIMPGIKGPLQTLNVGFNKIKSSGMRVLMKAVAESRSIRSVSVAGNSVDTTSAKFIAYALAHNHSLLSLSLDHCSIAQEGRRQIVAGIVSNSRTILREVRGFNVGPVVVTLGFPAVMEHWNNEHVVNFIHLMWERSNVNMTDAVQEIMDPLHFLASPDGINGGGAEKVGPHEASVVVDVAKKAFASLVEEGVDVFSRRRGHPNGCADASPISYSDVLTNSSVGVFPTPSRVAAQTMNSSVLARPNQSFVAPPEEVKSKAPDLSRKKRIVEWLCVNIQYLNKLGQQPFSSAELWKLHQHYFTPVVNESGGSVAPSPSPSADPLSIAMSSVPEVSVTSTNCPSDTYNEQIDDPILLPNSDPAMKASPFVGLSPLPMLKRKVSYRFLGDAALSSAPQLEFGNVTGLRNACSAPPAQSGCVAMMIECGPTGHTMPYKTKRARRNRSRISFLPKIKAKLDSYLDVCHEKALVTMRQLQFVEHAILSGQVNPIDPTTTIRTHLCGVFAMDAEMIVCDMI